MRMILIAGVALLALGGLGAGAYFYFVQPAEASAGTEVAAGHDQAAAATEPSSGSGGGGGGEHGEGAGVEFVKLDPLILPIINNEGLSQTVSLVVAIEVPGLAEKDEITKMTPRITDAFIQAMYGELSNQAMMKGGVLQINLIKAHLNKVAQKLLGAEKVKDVLLQVVQQRPA